MRKNAIGVCYFIIHLLIEITSYFVVFSCFNSEAIIWLFFLYDILAFMPESVYGLIRDLGVKINFGLIGMGMSFIGLILMLFSIPVLIPVICVGVGNGLVHIEGAEVTLRHSGGKMFPSALFVAGGAFGVVIGRLLASAHIPVLPVIFVHLLIFIPFIISLRLQKKDGEDDLLGFDYARNDKNKYIIIVIAVFVVIVRSYMGYIIPHSNLSNSDLNLIAIFVSMGVGKALGGYLIDKRGMQYTIWISTLGSLPFLALGAVGSFSMYCIGIMLFSMTMAVTLGLVVSAMKKYPGVAFGLTTIGLFIGLMVYEVLNAYEIINKPVLSTVILTLISLMLLLYVCPKNAAENKKKSAADKDQRKKAGTYVCAFVFMLMVLNQMVAYVVKNNNEFYWAVKYAYDKCHWSQSSDDKIIKYEEEKAVTYKIVRESQTCEYFANAYKEYLDKHPESFLNDGYTISFDFCEWIHGFRDQATILFLTNTDVNGNIHKEFDVGKVYCYDDSPGIGSEITSVKELHVILYGLDTDYLRVLNSFSGVEKVIVKIEKDRNDPKYINRITEYIEEALPGCEIEYMIRDID